MQRDSTLGDRNAAVRARRSPARTASAGPSDARRHAAEGGALSRGFAILRAFEKGAIYLGNVEISQRTGIPKATVSRLASTLFRLGYLSFNREFQKYSISPGILDLAYQVFMTHDLHVVARPLMQRLAEETQSTVGLAVPDGSSVVYLEYAKTRSARAYDVAIGYRLPIARTVLGRSCLSAMSADARDGLLREIRRSTKRAEWPELERRIAAAMDSVWKRGFCVGGGEISPANRAVGIPFVQSGRIYAFNCVAPAFEFSDDRMANEIGPGLIKLVRDLNAGG
jgi:DNA-binding IclR family transcriptional regulator